MPPAFAARGKVEDALLSVTLSNGADQQIFDCKVSLTTMVTLANAITKNPTGPNADKPSSQSKTPVPPTATPGSKYVPPTQTPKPGTAAAATKTPVPGGTPRALLAVRPQVPATPVKVLLLQQALPVASRPASPVFGGRRRTVVS